LWQRIFLAQLGLLNELGRTWLGPGKPHVLGVLDESGVDSVASARFAVFARTLTA